MSSNIINLQQANNWATIDNVISANTDVLYINGVVFDPTQYVPYTGANKTLNMGGQNIQTTHVPIANADVVNLLALQNAVLYVEGIAAANFVPYTGATSDTDLGSKNIKTTHVPTVGADLTNKTYVDSLGGSFVPYTGATTTVNLGAQEIKTTYAPTIGADLTNKTYVDTATSALVPYTGATTTVNLGAQEIKTTYAPTIGADLTNKTYVDTATSALVPYTGATSNLALGTKTISSAGGITSSGTITFTGLTAGTPAYTIGLDSSNRLITFADYIAPITGSVSAGYFPYASANNVLANSYLYQGTNFAALFQTTSGATNPPTSTTNTFTVNGAIYYTGAYLGSGLASVGQDASTNKNYMTIAGASGTLTQNYYGHTGTGNFPDAQILVSNTTANTTSSNTGQMVINAGSLALPPTTITTAGNAVTPLTISHSGSYINQFMITSSSSDTTLSLANTATSGRTWNIGSGGGSSGGGAGNFYIFDLISGRVPFVINSLGYVGIGTNNPGYLLDVVGNIRGTFIVCGSAPSTSGYVTMHDGNSVYSGYVEFISAGGTRCCYIGFADTSSLAVNYVCEKDYYHQFQTYNTAGSLTGTMVFKAGQLGIGTITPSHPLQVYQTIPIPSLSLAQDLPAQLTLQSSTGWLKIGQWYSAGVQTCGIIQASDYFSGSEHGVNLNLQPLGGFVGIGTIAPQYTLDVQWNGVGYLASTAPNTVVASFRRSIAYFSTDRADIEVGSSNTAAGNYGNIYKYRMGASYHGGNADFQINAVQCNVSSYTSADTVLPRLTIDSSGNCGIGTTAPTQALDVYGSVNANGYIATTSTNQFYTGNGGFSVDSRFSYGGRNSIWNSTSAVAPGGMTSWNASGYTLFCNTYAPTNAQFALALGCNNATSGGSAINYIVNLSPNLFWATLYTMCNSAYWYYGGTLMGYVYTGGFVSVSDEREKDNIADLKTSNSLSKVLKAKPKYYKRKFYDHELDKDGNPQTPIDQKDKDRIHIGLIAQDVLDYNPHCVTEWSNADNRAPTEEDDQSRYGINYQDWTIHLIGAVQEQQKVIDAQQTTITAQQSTITQQTSSITALQNQVGTLTSQLQALMQLCNDRFDKVGQLLKTVLPST